MSHAMSDENEVFSVPSWMPESPDAILSLCGSLPSTCPSLLSDAAADTAIRMMKCGQTFTQYFKSSNGTQQVCKQIRVCYVEDVGASAGAGKLYWNEKSRRSISQNRSLALDHITDIFLGAQTKVLKQALEIAQAAEAAAASSADSSSSPSPCSVDDSLLFSLLSDTSLLDLQASSSSSLCYWLWGLGVLMNKHHRCVNEKLDGASDGVDAIDQLNSSRNNCSVDGSVEITSEEMDAIKREIMDAGGEATANRKKRHTRKFSVTYDGSNSNYTSSEELNRSSHGLNNSMQQDEPSALTIHSNGSSRFIATHVSSGGSISSHSVQQLSTPLAALSSSCSALRATFTQQVAELNAFVSSSLQTLASKSNAVLSETNSLHSALTREQSKRRLLQNRVIELQGNIRVFARVRPTSKEEDKAGDGGAVTFPDENMLTLASDSSSSSSNSAPAAKPFEFDRVFAPNSTQADVFREVAPLIQSAVDGYSICIFAYGQTGTGKSYTMEGPPSDPGVNWRSISEIFSLTDIDAPNRSAGYEYTISLSCIEIYNETIRDLLVEKTNKNNAAAAPKLEIRQATNSENGSIYIPDLTELTVTSVDQVRNLISTRVVPNRMTASTNMNLHSSRSHCCVQLRIVGTNATTCERTHGKLMMIDLAGSERINKSGAEGTTLAEAKCINSSLSALGNVISSIQRKQSHIPFRDSKLTYLLSECLSGSNKCLMFVQVSPARSSISESSCSLQFALRARATDLGVAKKNKSGSAALNATVAAAQSAAVASTEEKLRKQHEALVRKMQAEHARKIEELLKSSNGTLGLKLKAQETTISEANSTIASLSSQIKSAEKELSTLRNASNEKAGATHVVTLQLKHVERENALLKDRLKEMQLAAQNANQSKEINMWKNKVDEARKKMNQPSIHTQAWVEPDIITTTVVSPRKAGAAAAASSSSSIPTSRRAAGAAGSRLPTPTNAAAVASAAASGDIECSTASLLVDSASFLSSSPLLDEESSEGNEQAAASNQANATKRSSAGKKRKSAELSGENEENSSSNANNSVIIDQQPQQKKLALDREEQSPFSANWSAAPVASRPRTAAAAASRLPALGFNTAVSSSASSGSGMSAAAGRTTRRTAAAATANKTTAAAAAAAATAAALNTSVSNSSSNMDDADSTSSIVTPTLSVTEAAMQKLEQRRLKYKAERAAASLNSKKSAATGGWKM